MDFFYFAENEIYYYFLGMMKLGSLEVMLCMSHSLLMLFSIMQMRSGILFAISGHSHDSSLLGINSMSLPWLNLGIGHT